MEDMVLKMLSDAVPSFWVGLSQLSTKLPDFDKAFIYQSQDVSSDTEVTKECLFWSARTTPGN